MTILFTTTTPENGHADELLDGLYRYHAIFVMQIIFSLNFVYAYGTLCIYSGINFGTLTRRRCVVGQWRSIRSGENDFRMKIFIGFQTHYRGVHFPVAVRVDQRRQLWFAADMQSPRQILYILCRRQGDRDLATGPFIIMTACTLLFRFDVILSVHMEQLHKELHKLTHKLKKRTKVWRVIARTETQIP